MATIKSYTDLKQSKKLAEILPLDSADMHIIEASCVYEDNNEAAIITTLHLGKPIKGSIPCWSLAALLGVLPEINCIPLTLEKVKAKDGYDGYYYPIEYEGIVLIPYSKNPIDACYEMILKLHELNLL